MKKVRKLILSNSIVRIVIVLFNFFNFVDNYVISLFKKIASTMFYINNADGQSMNVKYGSKL